MSSLFSPNRNSLKDGFVLVVALWVMAFMLLMLLSMGSLLLIESQNANAGRAKLEARMNARLAAYKALGELQRFTGPDQRVTARSDVLVAPGDPNNQLVTGQGRWTGVWSSREDELDLEDSNDGLNNRAVVWLVSGDQPDAYIDSEDEFIELATVNNSVSNKDSFNIDDTVRVATEEILGANNSTIGQYAYWVSDEGIKARVNLSDSYIDSNDPDASYYRATMAQVADPTAVSNVEGVQILTATDSRWKQTALDPSSITSLKNIPMFLEPNLGDIDLNSVNREFFHDFTVHSSGVLANIKDGGLKRDLSTALLDLPEDLIAEELIFEPHGVSPTPGDPGGPKWKQLEDYFKLSQSANSVTGNSVSFRMPTSEQVGIAPVVTRWNFIFHPFAAYRFGVLDALGNPLDEWLQSSYEYSLGIFPLITLWNPYNYDLVLPRIGLECEFQSDAVIRTGDRNTTTNTCTLDRMAKYHGGTVNRWALRFVIEAITIPAGKAINFTPPLNSYYSEDDPTKNVLKAGAHGELVNGFFSVPVVGSGNEVFYNLNNRNRAPWIVKQFPSVTTLALVDSTGRDKSLFNQVVNLYDLSDSEEFDLEGINRFKSLSFRGMPSFVNQMNITTTRFNKAFLGENVALNEAPQNFSDAIAVEGSSVGSSYSSTPQISLTDLEQWKLGNNLCGVSAYLKFPLVDYDEDRELPTHLTYNQNFTAPIYSPSINTKYYFNDDRYELYTRGPVYNVFNGSNWRNYLSGTDQKYSRVGRSNDFNGNEAAVFYNIPTKPILGIGQLMQANLLNVSSVSNGLVFDPTVQAKWDTNRQQAYAIPLYAIGNSIRNFDLPLSKTKDVQTYSVNGNQAKGANYDYCYELNDALWDRFFFSGYNSVNAQLPNSRLRLWRSSSELSVLESEKSAASHLLNEGAFNINSTSVAAWESILGAMRDVDVLGAATTQSEVQKHNFSRFVEPLEDSTDVMPLPITSAVTEKEKDLLLLGFRSLTDLQIKELASSIVNEIKTRASAERNNDKIYPFLSMAEFINRSLNHKDNTYKLRGILQAAIDKTSINGVVDENPANNTGLWEAGDLSYVPNFAENDLVLEKRPLSAGLSAFFMQADLLNKIGAMLQARSDTFTIRSYGSAQDLSTGSSRSRAYYEMTVQRIPEYVDNTVDSFEEPTSRLNQLFGRKYKILSERWVDVNNI
jgi:hypothetical protein